MRTIRLLLAVPLLLSISYNQAYAWHHSKAPAATQAANSNPSQLLHGYISSNSPQSEVASCIDEALAGAITRSSQAQLNDKQASKYNRSVSLAWKSTKCTINNMFCNRGFEPSIEGGQLMLDEKLKVHDKPSADCSRQIWLDRTHDKVVADVVELVTGLGTTDNEKRQDLVDDSMHSLKSYVGDEGAAHIYDRLSRWSEKELANEDANTFPVDGAWTIKERQSRVALIVEAVSKDDPVVAEVKRRVHKWSNHSKVALRTSQVVETTLNIVDLSPTIIGPAAQAAMLVFSLATGGFEEDKLIGEMYLGKRFQSRNDSFKSQAEMAVDSYQLAAQTHNILLAKCSEALVKRLGGDETWKSVCQKVSLASKGDESSASLRTAPVAESATSTAEAALSDLPLAKLDAVVPAMQMPHNVLPLP